MLFFWLVALLGFWECCAIVTSYSFKRSQCLQNQYSADTNPNIVGNLVSSIPLVCGVGDGALSANTVRSISPITKLKQVLGVNDFSIELWFQPKISLTANSALFSIGRDATSSSFCTNNVVMNQLMTSGPGGNITGLQFVACNQVGVFTGEVLTSPLFNIKVVGAEPELVHAVVNVKFFTSTFDIGGGNTVSTFVISTNYTINGVNGPNSFKFLSTSLGTFDPSGWDAAGKVNLFPTMSIASQSLARAGVIHRFAIYNKTTALSQAREWYQARLPNSLPVVTNGTATIQENGEVGDHSTHPEFYQQAVPTLELAIISLTVHDMENYAYGVPLLANRPKLQIVTLPAASQLYQVDGTEITAANAATSYITYDTATASYRVRIRPPLDQYSKVANQTLVKFSFAAIDGVTGLRSAETAWMHVVVTHVDKPPIAIPRTLSMLYGGYKELAMNGTDPDSAIVGAVITKNPSYGTLYQYDTYRTVDATTNAYTLQSGPPFRVLYEYTGPRTVDGNNRVGGDSFQFSMVDVEGRRSVPVTYTLSVKSPIVARAVTATTANPRGVEDARAAITVHGSDSSTEQSYLNAYIITPPKLGSLFTSAAAATNTVPLAAQGLLSGYISSGNYTLGGINVYYIGPANYFTTPTKTFNGTLLNHAPDSFSFKIKALSGGDSLPVTQYVHIKNVNDPCVLTVKQSAVTMGRTSSSALPTPTLTTSSTTTNSSSTINTSTDADIEFLDSAVHSMATTPGTVILTGFAVTDPDLGVDPVHITVATRNGSKFYLNSNYLNAVDFNSATYCNSDSVNWWCEGDGAVIMASFVAAPSDAVKVLNGMTFMLGPSTVEDTVVVTIYDGVGGNCLSSAQLGSGSIYNGCYTTSVSVKVSSAGTSTLADDSNGVSSALMTRLMYVGIALAVFFALVTWRYLTLKRQKWRKEQSGEKDSNPTLLATLRTALFGAATTTTAKSGTRRSGNAERRSRGRTPTRHHRRGSSSESGSASGEYSSSDSYSEGEMESKSGTSIEEEEYDVEAGRTPPRRGRDQPKASSLRTPTSVSRTPPAAARTMQTPQSPHTPRLSGAQAATSPEPNVRVETFANPYNRSNGETPTKTIVVYRDTIGADGRVQTEETRLVMPLYEDAGAFNAPSHSSQNERASRSKRPSPLKAFPNMCEDQYPHTTPPRRSSNHGSSPASKQALGRAPSCNTSPLRTTRLPGKRAPRTPQTPLSPNSCDLTHELHTLQDIHHHNMHDGTDQTVSTMTCSVSSPSHVQSASLPPLRSTPQRRMVASPESGSSLMRSNSAHKHTSRRDQYNYSGADGSEIDALAQVMRTPERVNPHRRAATASKSSGGAGEVDGSGGRDRRDKRETPSDTKRASSAKNSAEKASRGHGHGQGHGQNSVHSGGTGGTGSTGVSSGGSVWTEHVHRSGRIFYHNEETGKSTWKKPPEGMF